MTAGRKGVSETSIFPVGRVIAVYRGVLAECAEREPHEIDLVAGLAARREIF